MRSRQTGLTLIAFIIILIVVGFFAYMGMKLVPPYIDYYDVSKAIQEVQKMDVNGKSQGDVLKDFMFKLDFQYASNIVTPQNVDFKRVDGGTLMTIDYNQRVHFIYNIDFLLHFHKSARLHGNVY